MAFNQKGKRDMCLQTKSDSFSNDNTELLKKAQKFAKDNTEISVYISKKKEEVQINNYIFDLVDFDQKNGLNDYMLELEEEKRKKKKLRNRFIAFFTKKFDTKKFDNMLTEEDEQEDEVIKLVEVEDEDNNESQKEEQEDEKTEEEGNNQKTKQELAEQNEWKEKEIWNKDSFIDIIPSYDSRKISKELREEILKEQQMTQERLERRKTLKEKQKRWELLSVLEAGELRKEEI